jgi:NADH:ubiquinone oxidoreductase subunit E
MKIIQVCVGSSCFLRGAQAVIDKFQELIERYGEGALELKGAFCQEKCNLGVTVTIDGRVFTAVSPADVEALFKKYLLGAGQGEEK